MRNTSPVPRFLLMISRFWPYAVLAAIVTVLFIRNYTPGTWLTGWDNLHPEFDFKTNIIDRSLWSVWQEYQGLGVRAGNAHAADLPRQIGLWLLSLVVPLPLLRYIYHFLALFVGAAGTYTLLRRKILSHTDGTRGKCIALIGSIYYLLNLGTMQNFYVPYEAFSHFFASLPWLILSLFTFLDNPGKRTLLVLAAVHILAVPSFYIPTIFVVYALITAIILAVYIITQKRLQTATVTVLTITCINAFWLFPFAGFVINGTSFISQVKINRLFTDEAFLRNQKFGGIRDIAHLKGFFFDTADMKDTFGNQEFLMKPWMDYLSNPGIGALLDAVFVVILLGYGTVILSGNHRKTAFFAIFALSLFALFSTNPPSGIFFEFLQEKVPLFKQVLRFPYTKFIVPAILTYSVGIALCIDFLVKLTSKNATYALIAITPLFTGALFISQFPSFQGNFIYPKMRLAIPQEYFAVFSFFKNQPNGRIANLPQPTWWGWTTYNWDYRGSGFSWYGIRQPILDRAFDVWNATNEAYYQGVTYALFTRRSIQAFEEVFDTYGIQYLWIDERVISPDTSELLALPRLKRILSESKRFTKLFEQGRQRIYRFDLRMNQYVRVTSTKTSLAPFRDILHKPDTDLVATDGDTIRLTATLPKGDLSIPLGIPQGSPMIYEAERTPDGVGISSVRPSIVIGNGKLIDTALRQIIPVPLGSAQNIISINDTVLADGKKQFLLLRDTGNTLRTYQRFPALSYDISLPLYKEPLKNCLETVRTKETQFGKQSEHDGRLTLFGRSSYPCLFQNLGAIIPREKLSQLPPNTLLTISLDYMPDTNEKPDVCLTRQGETECFYQTKDAAMVITPETWQKARFLVPIQEIRYENVWIKVQLDALSVERTKQITYGSFALDVFTPTDETTFAIEEGNDYREYIAEDTTITLIINPQRLPPSTILPASYERSKRNCYKLARGLYDRQKGEDPTVGSYLRYSSIDASSCDSFPVANKYLSIGTLALYLTRNVSGRPIKTCLRLIPSKFCLFEEVLPVKEKNQWAMSSLFSTPVEDTAQLQYFVELENYAVGQEKRVNDIASIQLIPIPIRWMTGIQVIPREVYNHALIYTDQGSRSQLNTSVVHPNPAYYSVSLSSTPLSSTSEALGPTLILLQSFDPGWMAYVMPNLKSQNSMTKKIQELLPFLFGTELKNHVLVNNWANAWLLEEQPKSANEAQREPSTNSSERRMLSSGGGGTLSQPTTIIIFFWPQLLEWLGFLLLPIPFLYGCLRRP